MEQVYKGKIFICHSTFDLLPKCIHGMWFKYMRLDISPMTFQHKAELRKYCYIESHDNRIN